ncbi:MAG: ABC transporter permease [Sporichthyaceae bacterium]|nr:ABC transporter permease [Sporichthyaceae bacterium]
MAGPSGASLKTRRPRCACSRPAIRAATGGLLGTASEHSTLTLLAPGLLALACAVLAARILPYLARPVLRLTRRHGGIGPFLAARRLARGTGPAATLIVLVNSLGLVTFATAAWSSARTNHTEVALTQLGADTVLSVSAPSSAALADAVRQIDPAGTSAVAVTARRLPAGATATMIAVDPVRFAQVAYWRDDLASRPLPELLESIAVAGLAEPVLLTGSRLRASVQLQASPRGLYYRLVAQVHVPGSRTLRQVQFGELRDRRQVRQEAALPGCREGCELRGLTAEVAGQEPGSNPALSTVRLRVADLQIRTPDGWQPVDAGFTRSAAWRSQEPETADGVRPGSAGLILEFFPIGRIQAIPNTHPDPLPALTTGGTQPDPFGAAVVGLDGAVLAIAPVERTGGLPGVAGAGVLVDQKLAERAAFGQSEPTGYEVWCAPGAADRVATELEAAGIPVIGQQRAADLAMRFGSQGPGLALRLLLAVAAAAALLATGATAIELYATSRRRGYELAALAAVGAKRRSLRTGLLLEHAVILGAAAVVGPLAGLAAAWSVVSKVPTFAVTPITPPLRYPIEPGTIAIAAGAALLLAVVTTIVMTEATTRAARAEQLREGPG